MVISSSRGVASGMDHFLPLSSFWSFIKAVLYWDAVSDVKWGFWRFPMWARESRNGLEIQGFSFLSVIFLFYFDDQYVGIRRFTFKYPYWSEVKCSYLRFIVSGQVALCGHPSVWFMFSLKSVWGSIKCTLVCMLTTWLGVALRNNLKCWDCEKL